MSITSGKSLKPYTKAFIIIAIGAAGLLLPALLAHPVSASTGVDNLGLLQMGTATGGAHIQPCTGDSCGTGLAWAQIFNAAGGVVTLGANGVTATFIAENPGLPDFTTFFTSSNKNQDPISVTDPCFIAGTCPSSTLNWGTGNVPAKDVLTNVYSYAATNPANGHLIIYSGFERIAPNGDSHIDIEFYQNQVHLDQTPPCPKAPCFFVGQHTPGDIIVSMDFLLGGTLGSFSARTWTGSSYSTLVSATGEGCSTTGSICAFNNGVPIAGGSWPSYDSHANVLSPDIIPANGFTNYGIDVTALLSNTPCFSTTIGKTRSSGSFTAELKDFAGPTSFGICAAHIKIAPSAVNEVGVRHTFTVTFTQTIGQTSSPVPDGTKVSVTLTNANGASFTNLNDNCASPGTVNGVCTVSFTSLTPGTVTGAATGTITISGTSFTATTNGQSGNSSPAVKTFVDAFITIAPSAVNQVNVLHTFTIIVKENSGNGAGFGIVANGTKPVVTLTPTKGASVQSVTNNCATTGTVNSICTVSFTSPTGGVVNGTASVTLTILGVTVTRITNGLAMSSGPAIKKFVDAFITIGPSAINSVFVTHTFTITVQQDSGNGLGFVNAPDHTIVTVTLTASNGATITNPVDNCATAGTTGGICTVSFTSSTAGTVTGTATVALTIDGISVTRSTDGTAKNSGPATKQFVAGSLAWTKVDNAGNLLGGATFQVCRVANFITTTGTSGTLVPITPACQSVDSNTSGQFLLTGLQLGNYTIQESIAPPGFALDSRTAVAVLTINSPNVNITKTPFGAFVDQRSILKLTQFGYTNTPTGTPTAGVVSGITVYTLNFTNYGAATASLSAPLAISVTGAGSGTLNCTGGCTQTFAATLGPGGSAFFTLTINYANMANLAVISANLTASYTTNGLTRTPSGTPATISFTIQSA